MLSLSFYFFYEFTYNDMQSEMHWFMLFLDNIVLIGETFNEISKKLNYFKKIVE